MGTRRPLGRGLKLEPVSRKEKDSPDFTCDAPLGCELDGPGYLVSGGELGCCSFWERDGDGFACTERVRILCSWLLVGLLARDAFLLLFVVAASLLRVRCIVVACGLFEHSCLALLEISTL